MPVNPYDYRKVALRKPRGNSNFDIKRASYTVTKALWPFFLLRVLLNCDFRSITFDVCNNFIKYRSRHDLEVIRKFLTELWIFLT